MTSTKNAHKRQQNITLQTYFLSNPINRHKTRSLLRKRLKTVVLKNKTLTHTQIVQRPTGCLGRATQFTASCVDVTTRTRPASGLTVQRGGDYAPLPRTLAGRSAATTVERLVCCCVPGLPSTGIFSVQILPLIACMIIPNVDYNFITNPSDRKCSGACRRPRRNTRSKLRTRCIISNNFRLADVYYIGLHVCKRRKRFSEERLTFMT